MSRSTKIILVILFILVGIYALQRFTQRSSTTEYKKLFAGVDSSKIDSIFINEQSPILLARTSNGWEILKPIYYPADAGEVNLFLSKLDPSVKATIVAEKLTDSSAYGLDSGVISLSLSDKSGRILEMNIGKSTPDFEGCYAQVKGYPQVFEIPENLRSVLHRTVAEWRSKQIFPISFEEIRAGNFSIGDSLYQFVRTDTVWLLNKRKVPSEIVTGLFTRFVGLSAIDFVDSSTNSWNNPYIEYSLTLNNNNNISGKIFKTSTNTYLTTSTSQTTFVISPGFIDSFKNELIQASEGRKD